MKLSGSRAVKNISLFKNRRRYAGHLCDLKKFVQVVTKGAFRK